MSNPKAEQRFWSKVVKSSQCWLWTGAVLRDSKYGVIRWDKRVQPAHRVSWTMVNGEIPAGYEIDHVCHVRLCVNPSHLRLVTRKQNVENHCGPLATNKLGIRGVSQIRSGKYRAEMRHEGVRIHVGYFDTSEQAEEAVRRKRNELFTHNDWDRRTA